MTRRYVDWSQHEHLLGTMPDADVARIAGTRTDYAKMARHARGIPLYEPPFESLPGEEWRAVLGYEGRYEVSSTGRVRSLCWGNKPRKVPKLLRLNPNGRGYLCLNLCNARGVKKGLVHRLVLSAFIGPCPESHEGAHLNGIRADNRLVNLKWATKVENMSHKLIHGTHQRGERCGNAKLTRGQVIEIRKRCRSGATYAALGREYGVHGNTISSLARGKTWVDVPMGGE